MSPRGLLVYCLLAAIVAVVLASYEARSRAMQRRMIDRVLGFRHTSHASLAIHLTIGLVSLSGALYLTARGTC